MMYYHDENSINRIIITNASTGSIHFLYETAHQLSRDNQRDRTTNTDEINLTIRDYLGQFICVTLFPATLYRFHMHCTHMYSVALLVSG